jgi:hypothetical protein
MPSTSACDTSWPAAVQLSCPGAHDAVDHRGVTCVEPDAAFGSALTAMDLDADGHDELAIGSPLATVDGTTHAGAVWIYHSAAGGTLALASVLRDAVPGGETQLGGALSFAHVGTRDELLAGASGALAVRMFLCTGIPGDMPGNTTASGATLSIQCR